MYYAIQVQGAKEDFIISLINSKVSHDIFDEVFTPKREISRKSDGKEVILSKVMFPGYIFVSSNNIKEFSTNMLYLPQFAKVLGRDKETQDFVPLSDEECIMIDTLCGKDSGRLLETSFVSIQEGKKVKVIAGPLLGFEGKIHKVDLHKRVAYVEVSMLGNTFDVQFGINFLKFIDE